MTRLTPDTVRPSGVCPRCDGITPMGELARKLEGADGEYAEAMAARVARNRLIDAAPALLAALESIPQMHEDEAVRQFRAGDPGAANAHRAWAKRIREHISPTIAKARGAA